MTQLEIHNLNERVWTDIVEYRRFHRFPTSQDFDNKLEQLFINLVGEGKSTPEFIHWMLMGENTAMLRRVYQIDEYHNSLPPSEQDELVDEFKEILNIEYKKIEDIPVNSSRSPEFKKQLKELIKSSDSDERYIIGVAFRHWKCGDMLEYYEFKKLPDEVKMLCQRVVQFPDSHRMRLKKVLNNQSKLQPKLPELVIQNSKPKAITLPQKKYKIVDFDDNVLGETNDMESAIQCFLERYPQFSKKHIHPFIIENKL